MTKDIKTVYAKVYLKPGRGKPIRGGNPWVYSGAIETVEDYQQPGQLVKVYAAGGGFLGQGFINLKSQIPIRLLTWEDLPINKEFFEKQITKAIQLRNSFKLKDTDTYRVINAEGDYMPGLIVDRYGPALVCQILSAGMELWRNEIIEILLSLLTPHYIYERSDTSARKEEGLPVFSGPIYGGSPPLITVCENGLLFYIDLAHGQKTAFYIDQRDNRRLVETLSRDRTVLNLFSYTGAFSIYAIKGGAKNVTNVEISSAALELARKNHRLNGFLGNVEFIKEDVFDYLRNEKRKFDLIILDPPAFAKRKSTLPSATKGYKDINRLAFKCLVPNGLLFTFSCSKFMERDLFQKVIMQAASEAGVMAQILHRMNAPFDHPINLHHPQGDYLKGMLLRKI